MAYNSPKKIDGISSSTDNAIVLWSGTTGMVVKNSVPTVDSTGNISVAASASGATLSATVSNTSNTASSNALVQTTVAGTSAGDAFHTFTVAGTTNWSLGTDNSVTGDPFVIAASAALGTTNIMNAAVTGEINWPLQPAFLAQQASVATNATGDNTNYQIGSSVDLTEIFDQNGDFDPTVASFTAPVTGRYYLQYGVFANGGTVITAVVQTIVTSNRTYRQDPGTVANTQASCVMSSICDMDSADTATYFILMADTGGKVDDIYGEATNCFTWVSGNLEC